MLERDVYRTNFLTSRGWNMMRLWSRDWWTDKGKTLELIESKIEKATQKIISEGVPKKKRIKKESAGVENKALAGGLFDRAQKEGQVISTRLNKKVLARLEQDKANEVENAEKIKKINENADYNLVLEPILTAKEMKEELKKSKPKGTKTKKTTTKKVEVEDVNN